MKVQLPSSGNPYNLPIIFSSNQERQPYDGHPPLYAKPGRSHGINGSIAMESFTATPPSSPSSKLNESNSPSVKSSLPDDVNYQRLTPIYSEVQWKKSSAGRYHNYGTGSNKWKRHEPDNTAAYKLHGRQSGSCYYAGCEGKHGRWQNTALQQPRKPKNTHSGNQYNTSFTHTGTLTPTPNPQPLPSRCTSGNSDTDARSYQARCLTQG